MSASRILRQQRRERHARVRALLRPKLPPLLLDVWDSACWIWSELCLAFATPGELAAREWIDRGERARLTGWIHHLERVTRRLILAAALALDIVLKPLPPRVPAGVVPRTRRRVLVWPQRPETWIARFSVLRGERDDGRTDDDDGVMICPRQRAVLDLFPLARRLEAVRRVLLDPERRAHRLAVKLARIKAANQLTDEPRLLALRTWQPSQDRLVHGEHIAAATMEIIDPIARNAIEAWNAAPEPD